MTNYNKVKRKTDNKLYTIFPKFMHGQIPIRTLPLRCRASSSQATNPISLVDNRMLHLSLPYIKEAKRDILHE